MTLVKVFTNEKQYYDTAKEYDKITQSALVSPSPDAEKAVQKEEENDEQGRRNIPISVDFDNLTEEYSCIKAWIYSEDTKINYPVVQGINNEYYLDHLPNDIEKSAGSIYIDCGCQDDFTNINTIIYGHNMLDESMFGSLKNYKEQEYYDEHPYICLLTPDGNYYLDILSGFYTPGYSRTFTLLNEWDDIETYISDCMDASIFESFYSPSSYERFVLLATCSSYQDDYRFILLCGLSDE